METKVTQEDLAEVDAKLVEIGLEQRGEVIESDTFKPTGKTFGFGCWGEVSEYTDPAGHKWALKRFAPNEIAKRQMQERNLTEEGVMRNEAIPLAAAQHQLVPRIIERDKKGKLFLGMPVYERRLSDELKIFYQGMYLEGAIQTTINVSTAVNYLHRVERRAHGDIKPDNILLDGKNALLTDLGSSTCVSVSDMSSDPRDRIGDRNYRSPEGFKENSRPTERSDIFSLGALLYKMSTGEGIYEGMGEPEKLTGEQFKKLRKEKLKKVPRKIRKIIAKATEFEEYNRYENAENVRSDLEKALNQSTIKEVKEAFTKYILPVGIPIFLSSALMFGAATKWVFEKNYDFAPQKQIIHGPLYFSNSKDGEMTNFDIEPLTDLPFVAEGGMLDTKNIDRLASYATEDRTTAYLLAQYQRAAMTQGLVGLGELYLDNQFETWRIYTVPDARTETLARTQERFRPVVANGNVDLEDLCVIARLGENTLNNARRASGSFDFAQYIQAKDEKGKYLIPKNEQTFLKGWIAQIEDHVREDELTKHAKEFDGINIRLEKRRNKSSSVKDYSEGRTASYLDQSK